MQIELTETQGKTLQQLLETEIRRYRKLIDYWYGIDPAGREFLVTDSIEHYTKKTRDLDELLNMVYKAQGAPMVATFKKPFIVGE